MCFRALKIASTVSPAGSAHEWGAKLQYLFYRQYKIDRIALTISHKYLLSSIIVAVPHPGFQCLFFSQNS